MDSRLSVIAKFPKDLFRRLYQGFKTIKSAVHNPLYLGDKVLWSVSLTVLILGMGIFLFLSVFIVRDAYPVLAQEDGLIGFLFMDSWSPLASPASFGILHAWIGSLSVAIICLSISIPIAFGLAVFIAEIAPGLMRTVLQPCLDLLAGIPAVVYGFVGYVTLVPWFERIFGMVTGESIVVAAIMLAVMALPFITSTMVEAFSAVPRDLKEAVLAQGVTRWYMIRRVIVAKASSGMFAGVALGLARAIGETLAVTMLAGNSIAVPRSLLSRGQPIPSLIITELGEAGVGSPKYHALFASGLLLMLVIVLLNSLVWKLRKRFVYEG